jgi:hypothetical protein
MGYRGLGVEYGNMGQYETAFDRARRRRRSFKPSSDSVATGFDPTIPRRRRRRLQRFHL